ncbi:MAG: hypothetical protein EAZ55_10710 [Cytophagales bacterium]|nr:MAG: hypothetical protein EAZ55_10710 [Cytophagales bacterium]
MKKLFFTIFAATILTLMGTQAASAQQYFVYDGDTFSVMLTTTSDNSKITKVQFSADGKWVDFKIQGFTDLEDTEEEGFLYTVLDGSGKEFTIDYYRVSDKIIVTNTSTGDTWTLYRRQ